MEGTNTETIPDEVLDAAAPKVRCTDVGNAMRLAVRGREKILYVPGPGWMVWDGKRWKRDTGHVVNEHAKRTARGIYAEAADCDDSKVREALAKWAKSSEARGRISAMVDLARSEDNVRLDDVALLDASPNLLNVQNGVLDLDTLELGKHDPKLLQTKLAGAAFKPGAECPFWLECLDYFLPDPEVREWVQMAAGYSMLGSYSEWLLIPYGPGANFKSTFLWALRRALGDYACEAAPELLTNTHDSSARSDAALADLRGMRLVTTIETEQGRKMAEALMKQLTGESRIKAKFMRQDYFEFENTSAVWLATNHKPVVQGTDYAAWRRIRLVPFGVIIPKESQRPADEIKAALEREIDGILGWLVDGLRKYKERGSLDPAPEAVDAATAAYREEMDALGQWLGDCCEVESDAHAGRTELRKSYELWCEAEGRGVLGGTRFREQLEERGLVLGQARIDGIKTKTWVGVRLLKGQ